MIVLQIIKMLKVTARGLGQIWHKSTNLFSSWFSTHIWIVRYRQTFYLLHMYEKTTGSLYLQIKINFTTTV